MYFVLQGEQGGRISNLFNWTNNTVNFLHCRQTLLLLTMARSSEKMRKTITV
jgi:hypothetical protein